MATADLAEKVAIQKCVAGALKEQPVVDMHSHLYGPAFGTPVPNSFSDRDPGGLLLWGVDELVTYHYLVAEMFRVVPAGRLSYAQYWKMSKTAQADLIWDELFVERSPISEACRGVLTTLQRLGMDTSDRGLDGFRSYFSQLDPNEHIDNVMRLANVSSITMTNNVFDDNERKRWLDDPASLTADRRFKPVLRFDLLLKDWPAAAKKLREWGYLVNATIDSGTIAEVQRFLRDWLTRTKSIYAAVSLTPDFRYPAVGPEGAAWAEGNKILAKAVLPVCSEFNIPFAMMIGSERGVNPALGDAGDMGFAADVRSVTNLCNEFFGNRFFVTMLSRENQHELAVAARKFRNLMVFGCWWFLNVPSMIEEITKMRTELLGTSFIPQHSDARVLEQLLYKWEHSRAIIGKVLTTKYQDLAATGWSVRPADVKRDVKLLLQDNFLNFLAG